MGLFSRNRECAKRLEDLAGLLNGERERLSDNQRVSAEFFEKINKKQARTEALCEDILETLSESVKKREGVSTELFCHMMEYLDLLSRYCARSRDEVLAKQASLLTEKTELLLREYGMERICAPGVPADPALHEIESAEEPPSPELNRTVANILAPGYRMGGRVLQRAKVTAYIRRNGEMGL